MYTLKILNSFLYCNYLKTIMLDIKCLNFIKMPSVNFLKIIIPNLTIYIVYSK